MMKLRAQAPEKEIKQQNTDDTIPVAAMKKGLEEACFLKQSSTIEDLSHVQAKRGRLLRTLITN